ncbi:hypothetical protein [Paracidovorax konjaci]|uniref:hypothetical protein n=1 Tax=Paracidovorax konjaci TaxID=32040 RepID=UPI0011134A90|nr:hypothetical protein [Paracidovorax konjaci]
MTFAKITAAVALGGFIALCAHDAFDEFRALKGWTLFAGYFRTVSQPVVQKVQQPYVPPPELFEWRWREPKKTAVVPPAGYIEWSADPQSRKEVQR